MHLRRQEVLTKIIKMNNTKKILGTATLALLS